MENVYLCVYKTSQYADIETQEIDRIILVVAGIKHHLDDELLELSKYSPANEHAQIGDEDVLEAADDGRR